MLQGFYREPTEHEQHPTQHHGSGGRAQAGCRTLHRWRKAGKGPVFVEMGRKVYYRRADLDRWVDGQRRQPQSQADAVTTRNSP